MPNCSVEYEPPVGQPVEITVESGDSHELTVLVYEHERWTSCGHPCRTIWPGAASIRVREGSGDDALTFPVDAMGTGTVALQTIDDASLADALRALGFDIAPGTKIDKLVGDVTVVPSRIEATIVGNNVVVVEHGPGSDRAASLDRYYDDVVAIKGAGVSCTAVVVGVHSLLTAGHCAAATSAQVVGNDGHSASVAIKHAVRYPDPAVDVALMTVESDLGVPVRARAHELSASPGLVKLVGFGTNERTGERGYGIKRQALAAAPDWRCTAARAARTGCRPDTEIVISTTSDSCTGDSGAPVLEQAPDGWRLVAITSRAIPSTRSVCGGGGIYTSVAAISGWLDDRMQHE